jgi:outer membrane receptor protein involved in Fe transport
MKIDRPIAILLATLAVCGLALVHAPPAEAQAAVTGSIRGGVSDDAGNFLPGASVVLSGAPLGDATRSTITDWEGTFRLDGLRVGLYSMTVSMVGYREVELVQIVVNPGSTRDFEVKLQEGLTERVTVRAERPLVDKGNTSSKEVVDATFVNRLPLVSRRYQQIMPLFPGVSNDQGFTLAQFHVNGGRVSQTGYRLDGATINDFVTGTFGLNVNQNSIERFELNSSGFQAEYGEQSAGIANIITKSGTNNFEFLYSGFVRNGSWGASLPGYGQLIANADSDGSAANNNNPRPETQQWQEFAFSGPLKQNKAWFAASVQYWQEDLGSIFNNAMRTGDRFNGQFKVTWQVSPSNLLVANLATDPASFGNLITDARYAPGTNFDQDQGGWFFQVRDMHTFGANMILESQLLVHNQYLKAAPSQTGLGAFQLMVNPGQPLSVVGTYPAYQDRDTNRIRLGSALTVQKGTHRIKSGFDYSFLDFTGIVDVADVIVNLDSIAEYYHGPGSTLNYTYNYRNPELTDRTDTEVAAYVQDTWVIDEHWTVEGGLRWDHQSIIRDDNIAPRAGVAYDPTGRGKSKIYANFGRFYDSVFIDFVDFLNTDGSSTTLNYYYADWASGGSFEIYSYDYATDGKIEAPYRDSWTVGFEQELPWDIKVGASATGWEGRNQLRATYTTDLGEVPPNVVLDPSANAAVILDSKGISDYRDWKLTVRKPFSRRFEILGSYTHSRVRGDTSEDFGFENRADQKSLEFTRLAYDRPDLVNLSAFANLPWGMEVTGIYRYQSGRLYSPLTFTGTIDDTVGNKNSQRMPAQRSFDFSLAKRIQMGDKQLKLTGQVFNLTNELNVIDVDRFSGSGAAFRQPVAVDFGRTVQFGLEFRHQ